VTELAGTWVVVPTPFAETATSSIPMRGRATLVGFSRFCAGGLHHRSSARRRRRHAQGLVSR